MILEFFSNKISNKRCLKERAQVLLGLVEESFLIFNYKKFFYLAHKLFVLGLLVFIRGNISIELRQARCRAGIYVLKLGILVILSCVRALLVILPN